MVKKVLIISTSLRGGSNSDILANECAKGAKEAGHVMHYVPEYYEMRDRCKDVVQTGDCGIHAQRILIAGYPSDDIPMDWLKYGITIKELEEAEKRKE